MNRVWPEIYLKHNEKFFALQKLVGNAQQVKYCWMENLSPKGQ